MSGCTPNAGAMARASGAVRCMCDHDLRTMASNGPPGRHSMASTMLAMSTLCTSCVPTRRTASPIATTGSSLTRKYAELAILSRAWVSIGSFSNSSTICATLELGLRVTSSARSAAAGGWLMNDSPPSSSISTSAGPSE